jgi:hypothetical protein
MGPPSRQTALRHSSSRFGQANRQARRQNTRKKNGRQRASLMTGRRPTTTGVLGNRTDFRTAHPDWISLPQLFKESGYVSLRTGKIFHGGLDDPKAWNLGDSEAQCGPLHWAQRRRVGGETRSFAAILRPFPGRTGISGASWRNWTGWVCGKIRLSCSRSPVRAELSGLTRQYAAALG